MIVQSIAAVHAADTVALLGDLQLSLFGTESRRLHTILVADGVAGRIDYRVAVDADRVRGVVLAAPRRYWWSAPMRHWRLAVECLPGPGRHTYTGGPAADSESLASPLAVPPPYSWRRPGRAWRVILIGVAVDARGKGLATQLYRAMMVDRSLVARIAYENRASIRLHRSLGWKLYRDGDALLAVHAVPGEMPRI